jgi:transcriptional regulator with XRE-family HTH domain
MPTSEMRATVARLMDECRRRMAKDPELALQMKPLVGRLYSDQTVSAWALGRTMPPADALLAACKVSGVSIDAALLGEGSFAEQLAALRKAVEELQAERKDD